MCQRTMIQLNPYKVKMKNYDFKSLKDNRENMWQCQDQIYLTPKSFLPSKPYYINLKIMDSQVKFFWHQNNWKVRARKIKNIATLNNSVILLIGKCEDEHAFFCLLTAKSPAYSLPKHYRVECHVYLFYFIVFICSCIV